MTGPGGTSSSGPVSVPEPDTDPIADGVVADPAPPGAAASIFGDRLPLATAYAELLVTEGVLRGLIGPREAPRIWERHLLNCAVVAELIPPGQVVLDVGSGAGLPGVVLAIARPDLSVGLIEPLARRADFLHEVVSTLGLTRSVTVCRARAEDIASAAPVVGDRPADVVTARAVAPLDRLAGWCLPLAAAGGRLLALKGSSAADEADEHRDRIDWLGGGAPVVRQCGVGLVDPPTTVVEIVRERIIDRRATGRRAAPPPDGRRTGERHGRRGQDSRRRGRG